ncbi:MAG TPA: homoserine dehydrogenase [Thermoanaerobaculia bacterium]|nr:homoserine dehydrogenase [Thermoanaerobaculia bacterium]
MIASRAHLPTISIRSPRLAAAAHPAAAGPAAAASAPLTVLALGSSLVAREQDLPLAVHEVYRWYRAGHRVVAVISDLAGATERLLAQARRLGGGADLAPRGVAALAAAGGTAAAALLALALDRAGVPAGLGDSRLAWMDPAGQSIGSGGDGLEAGRLHASLARPGVVVVPGCSGAAGESGPRLLGRGGPDLTALQLAQRLGADHYRLVEDADALYEQGPDEPDPALPRTPAAGAPVDRGPRVRRRPLPQPTQGPGPLRVVLLGLGTVGGGVFRHLLAQLDRFIVVGIAVSDPERHIRAGVPATLLERDPWRLLARPCDLVVEALGGCEPAARLIAAALARGRAVVSANKEAMAEQGERLVRHAAAHGAELRFSAAVGGAVPVLEAVTRAAAAGEVRAVRGVLNGTSNYVLDRLAEGCDLAAAVRLAQQQGFAEADPARDLDGRDAACKLRLLARAAFGVDLAAGTVACRGIDAEGGTTVKAAHARGQVIRLLAECRREGGGVRAEVRPVALPARDFLAGARGEENRVVIERVGGPPLRLAGRGAGRWPTAEAMLADILEIVRRRHRPPAALARERSGPSEAGAAAAEAPS